MRVSHGGAIFHTSSASHHWISDSLVYEYIGEVVQEREFLRRMQKYAQEGIQHFYFMMLQKDEVGIRLH